MWDRVRGTTEVTQCVPVAEEDVHEGGGDVIRAVVCQSYRVCASGGDDPHPETVKSSGNLLG